MTTTLRLGLTGGIGSGKSTVAGLLSTLGAAVIDADAISRGVTAPHGLAIEALAKMFGADYINADGALDRDKMRTLVYSDPLARLRLESIVHPLVSHEISRQAGEAASVGHPCIVFDIPLLVESIHWRQSVDQILVIDCTAAVQIQRVMARSALDRASVEKIIASQASRSVRLQAADIVIFNDPISLAQLDGKAKQVWHYLMG